MQIDPAGDSVELFFSALGLAMVLEGILYFAFPNQIRELAKRLPSVPNRVIRTFGITTLTVGLIVIYLGRHFF